MKKVNKLQIDTDRLMKKEELTVLMGGYWSGTCEVMCPWGYFNGGASASNCYTAELICEGMYSGCDCKCC